MVRRQRGARPPRSPGETKAGQAPRRGAAQRGREDVEFRRLLGRVDGIQVRNCGCGANVPHLVTRWVAEHMDGRRSWGRSFQPRPHECSPGVECRPASEVLHLVEGQGKSE